jgi:hypothetical protein
MDDDSHHRVADALTAGLLHLDVMRAWLPEPCSTLVTPDSFSAAIAGIRDAIDRVAAVEAERFAVVMDGVGDRCG